MKLKVGDIIYCIKEVDNEDVPNEHRIRSNVRADIFITPNKGYEVVSTRELPEPDICIRDDDSKKWWLGQKGSSECWDRWFVSEISFIRDKKINDLLHDEEDV